MGKSLVAGSERTGGTKTFRAHDPRTGRPIKSEFRDATPQDVGDAASAAAQAFEVMVNWPESRTASLLREIASALEDERSGLVSTADSETALGTERLEGELTRTTNQFLFLAEVVESARHLELMIDFANPDTTPPRPDIRRMLVPRGPVAVFGASNFPFAFSVPGGDTASALAAGCPVVAKGHPSHPATCELAARAISAAIERFDAPPGTFSMLQGGVEVGSALVSDPHIKAVGFTGSFRAGRALYDLAATRSEPIPVYAEMGSLNPVFITPGALASRMREIAEGFTGSMLLGAGQFCTKPGLGFLPPDTGEEFAQQVGRLVEDWQPAALLNPGIRDALEAGAERVSKLARVHLRQSPGTDTDAVCFPGTVVTAQLDDFLSTPELHEERFGPFSVLVTCPSIEHMVRAARELDGSLTATIHAEESELPDLTDLVAVLRMKAGRLVWNSYPTGVAVTAAMHHGGPYPATTDGLHTSVGEMAIRRWMRAVAYQGAPQALLPATLRDDNPLGVSRLVNGRWSSEPLS